jgi:hypothetical protein
VHAEPIAKHVATAGLKCLMISSGCLEFEDGFDEVVEVSIFGGGGGSELAVDAGFLLRSVSDSKVSLSFEDDDGDDIDAADKEASDEDDSFEDNGIEADGVEADDFLAPFPCINTCVNPHLTPEATAALCIKTKPIQLNLSSPITVKPTPEQIIKTINTSPRRIFSRPKMKAKIRIHMGTVDLMTV